MGKTSKKQKKTQSATLAGVRAANEKKAERLVGQKFKCCHEKDNKSKKDRFKKDKRKTLLAYQTAFIVGFAAVNSYAPDATTVKAVAEKPVVKAVAEATTSETNTTEKEPVEEVVELFNEFDDFEEIVFETEDDGEPVNFGEIAEMLGEVEEEVEVDDEVPASETIEGFATFEEIVAELEEDIKIFDENGNAIGEDIGCLEPSDFEKSISAMLEGKEEDLSWFSSYEIAEMLGMTDENFSEYGDFVLQFGDCEIGVSELLILNLAFKQGVMPCEIRKRFGTDDVAIYKEWCGVFKPHLKYEYLRSYFDLKIAAAKSAAKEVA